MLDKKIIIERVRKGDSLSQIARDMGTSRQRIHQIKQDLFPERKKVRFYSSRCQYCGQKRINTTCGSYKCLLKHKGIRLNKFTNYEQLLKNRPRGTILIWNGHTKQNQPFWEETQVRLPFDRTRRRKVTGSHITKWWESGLRVSTIETETDLVLALVHSNDFLHKHTGWKIRKRVSDVQNTYPERWWYGFLCTWTWIYVVWALSSKVEVWWVASILEHDQGRYGACRSTTGRSKTN